ncbi:Sterol O-acyltransferase [Ooceraea biroi]|uniref:O-acyltransferase n=1 Tax=Ooceraea biroi TaxID=2015173 RepID=A0A026WFZ2_OOCBI|nr:Sterol O-acyltransferase [Ooceraea biroi]
MMSEVLQNIETVPAKNGEFLYNADKYRDKKKSDKEGMLPDKEFLHRNSLLTDLFEITHIRTVYNLFIVILILLFLNTAASDIMESGKFLVGTETIQNAFGNFPACLYIWSFMQVSTFGIYMAFNIWAYQRHAFSPKSSAQKNWDYGWLTALIFYQVLFIILPVKAMLQQNLGICSNIVVLMEQTRMLMKSHAFIRSTASRHLAYKPHSELPVPKSPGFSQYLYFLFAPTLVYRDSYPRTEKIRWTIVIWNFFEFGLAIFYLALVVERMLLPVFRIFGTQPLEQKWYIKSTIEASVPGILFFMAGNYLLLHSWLNAWAELLRFADRMFYKDWWNCTSYRTYYRTWNVVVHDWLYTYIYKDIYEILSQRNKNLATFAVFFVSAVFHEYIIAFTFHFFYPVMFVLFGGFGFAFIFVGKIVRSNTFMWLSFCLGNGIMMSLYSIECYARANCLPHPDYYVDLFLPRSWNCQQQLGA